ncbi:MAG: hypothetical protein LM580_08365 [Thermofilum sp.]|jgi:hypothetical protein|nr:hypothetical protein [Thermofilum sp.]
MLVIIEPRGTEVEVAIYSGGVEVKRFRVKRVCTFDWMREGLSDDGCLDAERLPTALFVEAAEVKVYGKDEACIELKFEEEGGSQHG